MSNNKNSKKNKNKNKSRNKWVITIVFWTILISGSISLLSDLLLRNVNILVAFIILILIIVCGIIFDIIGVAVTAADEVPIHCAASKKVNGSKLAIKLVKNADKVSNFCNDVIGDVCGIISGSIGALIIGKIVLKSPNVDPVIFSTIIGALIAAFTIGGKAIGKSVAINNSNKIVLKVSQIIYLIKKDR
ncbi:hypothetical protein CLOACE_02050 [Clostridium acetireducens DSM 10703]|uniref:CNNM transmembrane domain-containing protein n=1 Tax=Clostridium acetireducens DSM 10703 TaxID=1121290 RepID=A0A1E8F1T1_9CLOT|nr:hypothetical protein [Clostridium acetireducens]OFI07601.1 hypothetical protein CLOACE_02050 [Clostridium acetireducens DSM 10703]